MRVPADRTLNSWIRELIRKKQLYKFYKTDNWKELRQSVLDDYHNECVGCLKEGKYTRAECVHHVNHVRNRPELALSKYYVDSNGKRQSNLLPLCNTCHNKEHPEKFGKNVENKFVNEEKW